MNNAVYQFLYDRFLRLTDENKDPLVTSDQVNDLLNVNYENTNIPVLNYDTENNKNFILQVSVWLRQEGYKNTYAWILYIAQNPNSNKIYDSVFLRKIKKQAQLEDETFLVKTNTTSGIYTCPRCSSREIEVTSKQVNAADEETKVFYKCTNCSKRW